MTKIDEKMADQKWRTKIDEKMKNPWNGLFSSNQYRNEKEVGRSIIRPKTNNDFHFQQISQILLM